VCHALGRADQAEVLLGPDPLQASKVVEASLWNRRGLHLEAVQGLVDGEASALDAGAVVGVVAGGDLGLDECAQGTRRAPSAESWPPGRPRVRWLESETA
jgi:hypothetical protein